MFSQKKSILFVVLAALGVIVVGIGVGVALGYGTIAAVGKELGEDGLKTMGVIGFLVVLLALVPPSHSGKKQKMSLPVLLGSVIALTVVGGFFGFALLGIAPLTWLWRQEPSDANTSNSASNINISSAPTSPTVKNTGEKPTNLTKFCSHCGNKVEVGGKFCASCGKPLV